MTVPPVQVRLSEWPKKSLGIIEVSNSSILTADGRTDKQFTFIQTSSITYTKLGTEFKSNYSNFRNMIFEIPNMT